MAYNKETGMYEGYIYKIFNDVNNILYVGRTYRTIKRRWIEHLENYIKIQGIDLYSAMRDIGVDHFNIEIIENFSANTKEKIKFLCIEREKYWIKYLKENDIKLYNMTDGGDDLREKMYTERPVIQYDLFCNELARFNSISEASEISGICGSSISACCLKNGKAYCTDNYIWRYIEEPLTLQEKTELNLKYKGVCQYDFDGNLLNTFFRARDAILHIKSTEGLDILPTNISECLRGITVSAAGYVWRYRNDPFDKYQIPRHIRKVCQYSFNGTLLNTYENCVDAEIHTGINCTSINQCCLHNYQKAGGYLWCYEGDTCNLNIKPKKRPVNRYDLTGCFIDSFDSIMDASRALNICDRNIGAVCNGKRKKAGGYIWKYKEDYNECYSCEMIGEGGDIVA